MEASSTAYQPGRSTARLPRGDGGTIDPFPFQQLFRITAPLFLRLSDIPTMVRHQLFTPSLVILLWLMLGYYGASIPQLGNLRRAFDFNHKAGSCTWKSGSSSKQGKKWKLKTSPSLAYSIRPLKSPSHQVSPSLVLATASSIRPLSLSPKEKAFELSPHAFPFSLLPAVSSAACTLHVTPLGRCTVIVA